jgi:hypothetical protein
MAFSVDLNKLGTTIALGGGMDYGGLHENTHFC